MPNAPIVDELRDLVLPLLFHFWQLEAAAFFYEIMFILTIILTTVLIINIKL